jgi:hypothetical protein
VFTEQLPKNALSKSVTLFTHERRATQNGGWELQDENGSYKVNEA